MPSLIPHNDAVAHAADAAAAAPAARRRPGTGAVARRCVPQLRSVPKGRGAAASCSEDWELVARSVGAPAHGVLTGVHTPQHSPPLVHTVSRRPRLRSAARQREADMQRGADALRYPPVIQYDCALDVIEQQPYCPHLRRIPEGISRAPDGLRLHPGHFRRPLCPDSRHAEQFRAAVLDAQDPPAAHTEESEAQRLRKRCHGILAREGIRALVRRQLHAGGRAELPAHHPKGGMPGEADAEEAESTLSFVAELRSPGYATPHDVLWQDGKAVGLVAAH